MIQTLIEVLRSEYRPGRAYLNWRKVRAKMAAVLREKVFTRVVASIYQESPLVHALLASEEQK
jgi:hypothetical protein